MKRRGEAQCWAREGRGALHSWWECLARPTQGHVHMPAHDPAGLLRGTYNHEQESQLCCRPRMDPQVHTARLSRNEHDSPFSRTTSVTLCVTEARYTPACVCDFTYAKSPNGQVAAAGGDAGVWGVWRGGQVLVTFHSLIWVLLPHPFDLWEFAEPLTDDLCSVLFVSYSSITLVLKEEI